LWVCHSHAEIHFTPGWVPGRTLFLGFYIFVLPQMVTAAVAAMAVEGQP